MYACMSLKEEESVRMNDDERLFKLILQLFKTDLG